MNTHHNRFKRTQAAAALLCVLSFTLLSGCASRGAKPVDATPVTQVMVLPVAPVQKLYTENKGIPVGPSSFSVESNIHNRWS